MCSCYRRAAISVVPLIAGIFLTGCGAQEHATRGVQSNTIERTAEKGPVKLLVRVSPRSPKLSDVVQMDVLVGSQPGVEVKPPAFGQAVGDFLVRDYSERPPEPGATHQRRFHYELEPAHAGKHLIHSVAVEFVDRRAGAKRGEPALVETDPLEVDVTSEWGGATPSLAKLEPMVPPRAVSQTSALGWVAAAVGLLAVFVLLTLRRRRRKPVEPRRQTPEEIAHEALACLLAEDLPARGLVKEFYVRLTAIVRQYVEATTGIRAPEQTTQEFLRDIRSRAVFPPDRSIQLASFLESADLIKYAGQVPDPAQVDQAIARAREFVNADPAAVTVET